MRILSPGLMLGLTFFARWSQFYDCLTSRLTLSFVKDISKEYSNCR